jgi:hypothetical protein
MLSAIVSFIFVTLVFYIFKKSKKLSNDPSIDLEVISEDLRKQFVNWNLVFTGLTLIFAGILGLTFYFLFSKIAFLSHSYINTSEYLIFPHWAAWALPAGFMGFLTAGQPLNFVCKLILGSVKFEKYKVYSNLQIGFDADKVYKRFQALGIPVTLVLFLLTVDFYARVTQDNFIINEFSSLSEKIYAVKEIQKIELIKSFKAPNGKIRRDIQHHQVIFNDGYIWSGRHINSPNEKEAMMYLSEISGKTIQVINPFP